MSHIDGGTTKIITSRMQRGVNLENLITCSIIPNIPTIDSNLSWFSRRTSCLQQGNILPIHKVINTAKHKNLIQIRPSRTIGKPAIPLSLFSLNCRSVKNKAMSIGELITSKDSDVIALTETWLGTDVDDHIMTDLVPPGYAFIHIPRQRKRGGGIAVLYKSRLCIKIIPQSTEDAFTNFENIHCSVSDGNVQIQMHVIYRPPPSKKNGFKTNIFFDQWSTYLDQHTVVPQDLIITGDLNFHLDDHSNADALRFSSILDSHGLVQQVTGSTHVHGHTLDVLITRDDSSILNESPSVVDPCLFDNNGNSSGDHFGILSYINIAKPVCTTKKITFRKFQDISLPDFIADIELSTILHNNEGTAEDLVDAYNSVMSTIIEKHAPLQMKTITFRPNTPWYTDELRKEKQKKRKSERRWRKTKLTVDYDVYKEHCKETNKLLLAAKREHYSNKISECGSQQKPLFKIVKKLMGSKEGDVLPSSKSNLDLANTFSDFFSDKICTIRENINGSSDTTNSNNVLAMDFDTIFDGLPLTEFSPTTQKEIHDIIINSPSKSCQLDPFPTHFLKQCLPKLLPIITNIINKSIMESKVPMQFKKAVIKPLIKKPNLDKEVLKNYRPVSNLSFLSKVLERVVAKRLEQHIDNHELHDALQSAYRVCHSTETAMLRVHHDIVSALDQKCSSVLILLDLSAAFDIIDHDILYRRLEHSFGISGNALSWIQSYHTDRMQCVGIQSEKSADKKMLFGVPQGSVLGPRIYCMYSKPIGEICRRHDLQYHCYADDTQLYITVKDNTNWDRITKQLESCLVDINNWMNLNKLKLNQEKTQLIVFSPKHKSLCRKDLKLTVGANEIPAVSTVKSLGVHFDASLKMEKQVNAISRSCFYQIRNIGKIRKFLTDDTCKILVHSLVTSRLDYGNAILYGITKTLISKLQRVQNTAARLITRTRKRDHITPILINLHWLPVTYRIQYKILVHTYRIINGTGPSYLCNLVTHYKPARPLRSQSQHLLNVPKTHTAVFGDRRFDKAAAFLWNSLPLEIRDSVSLSIFKMHLKTHLFRLAFSLDSPVQ
jgi:exonuclease III